MTNSNVLYAVTSLPKTGQTTSYTTTDDGELELGDEWPTARFTDNQDGTLSDNLTGLMWIKDAYCATHFISGAASSAWESAFAFVSALNEDKLTFPCENYDANYSDWRVPNINELMSLMRAGLTSQNNAQWLSAPASPSSGFINVNLVANPIWSSTTNAANPDQVWVANLIDAETSVMAKQNPATLVYIFSPVRTATESHIFATGQTISYINNDDGMIQAGLPRPQPRYVSQNNGTVLDKMTGLMWIQHANCAAPSRTSWQQASNSIHTNLLTTPFFATCSEYDQSHDDWRIPNINELRSLVNFGQHSPAIDPDHLFTINTDSAFWSSTSSNESPDTAAWSFAFQNGNLQPSTSKSNSLYAWPVRGPIDFPDIGAEPTTLDFGSEFINNNPVEQTLKLINSGTETLTINDINITSSTSSSGINGISIGHDACSNRTLEAATSCIVNINFIATREGAISAQVTIQSDALGLAEYNIPITATGLVASEDKSSSKCFVATATFGSALAPEVTLLRQFRDNVLLKYAVGRKFVENYYLYSPPMANFIEKNPSAKIVSLILLYPIVAMIKYPFIFMTMIVIILSFYTYRFIICNRS